MLFNSRIWSRLRTLLRWGAAVFVILAVSLASACRETAAPKYIPPGEDSSDTDTTITLQILPGNDGTVRV